MAKSVIYIVVYKKLKPNSIIRYVYIMSRKYIMLTDASSNDRNYVYH